MQIVNDPVSSAQSLNADLSRLNDWASQWLITFNASKTEVITFSTKRKKANHPPLYLGDNRLSQVDFHTHLGLIFTSDLSWNKHINFVVSRASQ